MSHSGARGRHPPKNRKRYQSICFSRCEPCVSLKVRKSSSSVCGKVREWARGQGTFLRPLISLRADCAERAPSCSPSSCAWGIAASLS